MTLVGVVPVIRVASTFLRRVPNLRGTGEKMLIRADCIRGSPGTIRLYIRNQECRRSSSSRGAGVRGLFCGVSSVGL